jgi:hypothetical protein
LQQRGGNFNSREEGKDCGGEGGTGKVEHSARKGKNLIILILPFKGQSHEIGMGQQWYIANAVLKFKK